MKYVRCIVGRGQYDYCFFRDRFFSQWRRIHYPDVLIIITRGTSIVVANSGVFFYLRGRNQRDDICIKQMYACCFGSRTKINLCRICGIVHE